jgi:YidC/Oxa1 family membrane protein insertase
VLEALASPVGYLLAYIHTGLSTVLISGSGPAWALSIVLLTVTVRLLLFPLFVKQIKSQRRMQELAPKIKELQKAHKGDRETMNTEMMKLYKENNANPISGCLPLLLQLPVFFALFTVIREFRTTSDAKFGLSTEQLQEGAQAKVFGAPISAAFNSTGELLSDLAADQSTVRLVAAVMVVLMGATTFWTQRQMIARSGTTDPQQVMIQKLLLYVLPLSFAVSGAFFPIGVLLYWLTTNVWSMGQQAWVIKRMPPVNLTPGAGGLKGGGSDSKGPDSPQGGGKGGGGKGGGKAGKPPKGTPPETDDGPAAGAAQTSKESASASASASTSKASVPAGVGGRTGAASRPGSPGRASGAANANRRPSGSRKNKNRRGGRR